jgi:predicted nucleotidyltransferase
MDTRKAVSLEEIQRYAGEIAKRFHPERIILFGSCAHGTPDVDSDVDLLVVLEFEGRPQEQAFEIRRTLPRSFPLDLLVRRPEEIRRRIRLGDFFIREIMERGVVLYDRTRP